MGAFFPIGKGSVYVAYGNRMGGNELCFPRVGKREVISGATPPSHLCNSWRKKRQSNGFDVCESRDGGCCGRVVVGQV